VPQSLIEPFDHIYRPKLILFLLSISCRSLVEIIKLRQLF
jgi:hypothetical protein